MGARGERTFRAGAREVSVLFTNRALANAENRLGKGIVAVAQGLVSGQSGLGDVALLLQAGMEAARIDARAGGRQVSMDDAYEVLDNAGFATVAGLVMEAVADVLSYAGEENVIDGSAGSKPDPNA